MNDWLEGVVLICLGVLLGLEIYAFAFNTPKQNRVLKIPKETEETDTIIAEWKSNPLELNEQNLYNELIKQKVDFPEIVKAQAILETGNFKSYSCKVHNNLFGLKKKNGAYMYFEHWTLAVAAYKKYIQKYKTPPNDYYKYLQNLGYAEDKMYITKLKQIVNKK